MAIFLQGIFKKLQVLPIAAESLGVRSMATFVKTPSLNILIDPGAAIAPKRYGLPPHPLELEALEEFTEKIRDYAKVSDVIVISHYHHDHYKPPFEEHESIYTSKSLCDEMYTGKTIFIKDYSQNINFNGKKRAKLFRRFVRKRCKQLIVADGGTFILGDCQLSFSPAVFHGERNSKQGFVIMTSVIVDQEVFLHASDVQGPMVQETSQLILSSGALLAYIGGPPSYLAHRLSPDTMKNAHEIMDEVSSKLPYIIIDHHLPRDLEYRLKFADIFSKKVDEEAKVVVAAEFLGKKPNLLEARRKTLHEERS